MKTYLFDLVSAGDMSGDIESEALNMQGSAYVNIQAIWTGATAAGSIKIQTSNDGTNYTDYSGSSTTVAGAGDFVWRIPACSDPYLKVVFIASSGTGTLNVTAARKED